MPPPHCTHSDIHIMDSIATQAPPIHSQINHPVLSDSQTHPEQLITAHTSRCLFLARNVLKIASQTPDCVPRWLQSSRLALEAGLLVCDWLSLSVCVCLSVTGCLCLSVRDCLPVSVRLSVTGCPYLSGSCVSTMDP